MKCSSLALLCVRVYATTATSLLKAGHILLLYPADVAVSLFRTRGAAKTSVPYVDDGGAGRRFLSRGFPYRKIH